MLSPERVRVLDVPFTEAVRTISQWDSGSRKPGGRDEEGRGGDLIYSSLVRFAPTTGVVPVRGYAKGCSAENVEFAGLAG